MNLIERYIYTVTKRLPATDRQEVETELRGSIMEMLPDDYTEEDVKKVLYELGNPAVLSENYRSAPRYLIGPNVYSSYIYVLKLVLIIIACIAPIAALATVFTNLQNPVAPSLDILIDILVETLSIFVEGAFRVFAWVTFIFFMLDKFKVSMQWPYTGKRWTVEDLEEAETDHTIKKSDPVLSIITIMVFTTLIGFFSKFIGWYTAENGTWQVTPLFEANILQRYIPFLFIVAFLGIVVAVLKLIYKQWNRQLIVLNSIYTLCETILVGAFLLNITLYNKKFIALFADAVGTDTNHLLNIWQWSAMGLLLLIVGLSIWDIISTLSKQKKVKTA